MSRRLLPWLASLALHVAIMAGLLALGKPQKSQTVRLDLAFLKSAQPQPQANVDASRVAAPKPRPKPVEPKPDRVPPPQAKPPPQPKPVPLPEPEPATVAPAESVPPPEPKPAAAARPSTAGGAERPDAGPLPSGPVKQATVSPPEPSPTAAEQYISSNLNGIRQQVLKELRYPAIARRQSWSGQVRLEFVVLPSGSIEDLKVVASSGYPLLDRQALRAIRSASPFPTPPVVATVTLPITFRLD